MTMDASPQNNAFMLVPADADNQPNQHLPMALAQPNNTGSPSKTTRRASADKLALRFIGATLIELRRLGKHGEPPNANGIKQITLTLGCWNRDQVFSFTSSGNPIPHWYHSFLPEHLDTLHSHTDHGGTFIYNMSEMMISPSEPGLNTSWHMFCNAMKVL